MGFFSKRGKRPARSEPEKEKEEPKLVELPIKHNLARSASSPYASKTSIPYNNHHGLTPSTSLRSAKRYSTGSSSTSDANTLFEPRTTNPDLSQHNRNSTSFSSTSSRCIPSSSRSHDNRPTSPFPLLTTEQEEADDIKAIRLQARHTKQSTISSSRNALHHASRAEQTGRATLARLGEQGERLYATDHNLDMARSNAVVAEEKGRELKKMNGGLWNMHIKNPLKSKSRAEKEQKRILERAEEEREMREGNRREGWESRSHVKAAVGKRDVGEGEGKVGVAERSRFQVEGGDEEDDRMEDEIDENLTELGGVAGRLKALAIATGEEGDRQNRKIGDIAKKSDGMDDRIHLMDNKLKKIK